MAKKTLRSDRACSECGSAKGPCNMTIPKIVEPRQISIAGHCQDCGYSFTRVFDITLFEEISRK